MRPYVCLIEDCRESDTSLPALDADGTENHKQLLVPTFGSFASWISHMRKHPSESKWICSAPAHEPMSFSTGNAFENHMRERHSGTFADSDLSYLAQMSMRLKFYIFEECLFCDFTSDNRYQAPLSSFAQDILQKHIALHLEELTLLSIK